MAGLVPDRRLRACETRTTSSTSTPSSLNTRMASVCRSSQVTGPPPPQPLDDRGHRALGGTLAAPMPSSSAAVFTWRRSSKSSPRASISISLARRKSASSSGKSRGVTAESTLDARHARKRAGASVVPRVLRSTSSSSSSSSSGITSSRSDPAGAGSRGSRRTPSASCALHVDERVRNGDRHLVAQLGRAHGVAEDDDGQARHPMVAAPGRSTLDVDEVRSGHAA